VFPFTVVVNLLLESPKAVTLIIILAVVVKPVPVNYNSLLIYVKAVILGTTVVVKPYLIVN